MVGEGGLTGDGVVSVHGECEVDSGGFGTTTSQPCKVHGGSRYTCTSVSLRLGRRLPVWVCVCGVSIILTLLLSLSHSS